MDKIAVVMAGGTGTRFWPLSRRNRPKQVLALGQQQTMLESTIDRLAAVYELENIFVITAREHQAPVSEVCSMLPAENILGEPEGRDTAPCAGWGGLIAREKFGPRTVIGVFPADHQITPREQFAAAVNTASRASYEQNSIVTFGIRPDFPSTGYGYINYRQDRGDEYNGSSVYEVEKFTEKPDRERAREFLDEGDYLWNSGMFFWTAGRILAEIETYMPDLYSGLKALREDWQQCQDWEQAAEEHYSTLPEISVDYGILENSDHVWTLPVDFEWTDLGTWDALEELFEADESGNISVGSLETVNSEDNILVSTDGSFIGGVNIDNLIVVSTDDAVLVCDRRKPEDVKQLVKQLEARDKEDIL